MSARSPEEASSAGQPKKPVSDPRKKEVPSFEWKLIGYADGLTLTLLKSVEHKDVEAQLNRLQSEGHYLGLAIYPIDAKVPPPPPGARRKAEASPSRGGSAKTTRTQRQKDKSKKSATRAPARKTKAKSTARSKPSSAQKTRPAKPRKTKSARPTKKKSRTKKK